jgi:hypothetical protein
LIIYNVTIKVEHSIAEEWLQWLKKEHIPDMLNTGCFSNASVLRLLETDDAEGVTYAVQYMAGDKDSYDGYIKRFSESMRRKSMEKWGDKFIAFRTVMEVI